MSEITHNNQTVTKPKPNVNENVNVNVNVNENVNKQKHNVKEVVLFWYWELSISNLQESSGGVGERNQYITYWLVRFRNNLQTNEKRVFSNCKHTKP